MVNAMAMKTSMSGAISAHSRCPIGVSALGLSDAARGGNDSIEARGGNVWDPVGVENDDIEARGGNVWDPVGVEKDRDAVLQRCCIQGDTSPRLTVDSLACSLYACSSSEICASCMSDCIGLRLLCIRNRSVVRESATGWYMDYASHTVGWMLYCAQRLPWWYP